MKYDKKAIEELIQENIDKMIELADRADVARQKRFASDVEEMAVHAQVAQAWLDKVKTYKVNKPEQMQELVATWSRFGKDELRESLNRLANPAKLQFADRSDIDNLQRVLKVFKTGAPPEVSVTDLRAFGLLQFVKYGK